MKLSALLQDVETKNVYNPDTEITNVTDDTRKVRPNGLFVCISGSKTDGHRYAHEAVKNGAAVIICETQPDCGNAILVDDTKKAYAVICSNFYGNAHKKMRMIGVTGTNGKTTTSYILKKILDDSGHKVGLIGTVNVLVDKVKYPADLTTPDSADLHQYLSMMAEAGCDICIMEVSSQALIQKRVYSIEFDCGIFTNLTPEHLDYHKTMENYALAKSELFRHSRISVINADDAYSRQMQQAAKGEVITFSLNCNSDYRAENIVESKNSVEYDLENGEIARHVKLSLIGVYSVFNSMAAIAAASAVGTDITSAVSSLESFEGIAGRMEKIDNPYSISIIIDFAHTPDSLENALKTLKSITEGRLITVFGCGGDRDKTKRPEMGRIACKYSDTVFVTSDNPRTENPENIINDIMSGIEAQSVFRITDRTLAIRSAINSARAGDTVLIAGKGHEKYQISGAQKIYYNEREIIRKLLDDKARF